MIISNRAKNVDLTEVKKIFEAASKVKNPINLSIGQPDFKVPKEIKKAAINAIKNDFNSYTVAKGLVELRKAVALKFLEKNNIKADFENIIITNSVSGGLSIVLDAIIDDNDEVIIFDPYFIGYKQTILLKGGKPIICNLNNDFSINYAELETKITNKTKSVILNTPNNPTGKVYSEKELIELSNFLKKHDLLIISDEIYEDFCYDSKHFSIGSIYEKTVTLNGFSKSHAMTGWRIGYLTGPSEIIENAVKSHQFNYVSAPTPFQYAAIAALKTDMSKKIKQYKKKRNIMYNGLKSKYELKKPIGAFYAYVKYPYDGEKFINDCLKKSLVVVSGKAFSEKNTHFRISFANKDEILKEGVKILNNLIL